jgi:hypothetical protein
MFAASGASAATVSFNFNNAASNVFTSDGVTVTATAHQMTNSGAPGASATLGRYSNGLGVSSGRHDEHFLDGLGTNELIRFAFSEAVRIVSVTFTYADYGDEFSFGYQGPSAYVHVESDQPLNSTQTAWTWVRGDADIAVYSFLGSYTSTAFGIGAIDNHTEFKISGMTVETIPAVVPLPAAGLGLIAGLGALAALKRRKAA